MRGFDVGTFSWGLGFALLGTALALEAVDVWTLRAADLRYVGPVLVIVIAPRVPAR